VKPRVVLDESTTADGDALELAREHGHYIIRVDGVPLMSSEMRGSEEAMADVAAKELGSLEDARVLIGGLGMGFTLRATLDVVGQDAEVHVAELMPSIVRYNLEHLGRLADYPLEDPRVTLYQGDVIDRLERGAWDAILMDVDNGPDALSARNNDRLYGQRGVHRMVTALAPGGVLVVWSAYQSPRYLERLRNTGLIAYGLVVRGRWPLSKGPKHTLFVAVKPV
jgi:spermidine synthase